MPPSIMTDLFAFLTQLLTQHASLFERMGQNMFRGFAVILIAWFGAKSALDYLIREKLIMFADAAESRPEFAKELPRFLAGIWQVFNQYELAGYVASQKPAARKQLRRLLYMA